MRLQASLYGLLALSSTAVCSDDVHQAPLLSDDYACEDPPYRVHMVSTSPLVIYITDFLTRLERAHLLAITKDTFTNSGITNSHQQTQNIRTSQSTSVPRDPVVSCIESRALSIQGFSHPASHLEPLQLVRYSPTQHFHFHTDWFTDPIQTTSRHGGNRLSSFFAYVSVENGTTGGGTNFPMLDLPGDGDRWCEEGWVDCDEEWERGVTFRPVEGNAVFWMNLDAGGGGDPRTLHAGLPVVSGGKVGMNIWTRQGPLGEELRGR